LRRVEKEPVISRPQHPKKPYPYHEEEVSYRNENADIELAATLTTPKSGEPFPAVILISGSGPQDRDETIFNHKPFLVLADYLTRQGIAVLRVDDRGVGGSTGKVSTSTSADFAGDVLAGIEFLKKRYAIDVSKIGLIGHSEGGIVAAIAASRSEDVAFIVLMAGTGLTGEKILYLQAALIFKASGIDDQVIEKYKKLQREYFRIVKQVDDDTLALAELVKLSKSDKFNLTDEEKKMLGISDQNIEASLRSLVSPWFRYFLTYDPKQALRQVHCPVLALIGEKDLQVPADENLEAIKQSLNEAGNPNVTTIKLPGLNHLFQTAETGAPSEYGRIEETIAPQALETIASWIMKQIKN
ncbi:MAG: alpha/beta fold hydrolase, partial [bacterium]|nr:alpha/beta fold hydrolase [bacterium]